MNCYSLVSADSIWLISVLKVQGEGLNGDKLWKSCQKDIVFLSALFLSTVTAYVVHTTGTVSCK